jgi:uncharacterized membrane protein
MVLENQNPPENPSGQPTENPNPPESSTPDSVNAKPLEDPGPMFIVVMFIFGLLVVMPTLFSFSSGDDFLGENSFAKLLLLTAMGGALSSSLAAKTNRNRFLAIIPGVIMGIGVPLVFSGYIQLFNRDSLYKLEWMFLTLVGVIPGGILRTALLEGANPSNNRSAGR